jgi:hypothetical protein
MEEETLVTPTEEVPSEEGTPEEEKKIEEPVDDEEEKEEKTKEDNRYQRLIRKLEEKDREMESIKAQMDEALKAATAKPSAAQEELAEEMEEWFLEAFGDDDDGVSKKTFKEMKSFINRISRKAIENYVEEFNKKQTEEAETTNKYKQQFQKEYDALIDEGMDRFPLEQILEHSKVMMEKRAKRLGVSFDDIEVPDMELVYKDLDRLKPRPTKKVPQELDKSGDTGGHNKKVWSLKDLEKRRW